MKTLKQTVLRWAEKGLAIYDGFMEKSLAIGGLHTYYSGAGGFLHDMNRKYWHLDQQTFGRCLKDSPVKILGEDAIAKVLRRRIRLHALRAATVTFLSALPTNWVMWPLMVVDIVFFQREVFLFSQEAYMMYKPRRDIRKTRFDYVNVTLLVAKMLEPIVVRQVKSGLGVIGKFAVKRGVKIFRGPMQVLIRQIIKWFGVTATKEIVEKSIDLIVVTSCAFIGAIVSYWLFIPMAKRMQKSMQAADEQPA